MRIMELVVDEEYVPVDEREECASEEKFVLGSDWQMHMQVLDVHHSLRQMLQPENFV